MFTALTIAGSDSGGCAGIQADLKTFEALGVHGLTVLTSLTAQNTQGVRGVWDVPPQFVRSQLDAVLEDIPVGSVKTGMLSRASIIEVVAEGIRHHGLTKLVVDPVARATSGSLLIRPEAVETLKRSLIPLALVVTPNLYEAETLTGRPVRSPAEMREAARIIFDLGPRFVLVKGGHLPDRALDILFDGNEYRELAAEKIPTVHTHGSGCTFSAAIAAGLAVGKDLVTAATEAKRYVTEAIRFGYALGQGCGPLNQLWKQRAMAG